MNASATSPISTSATCLLSRWAAIPCLGIITGSGFQYTSACTQLDNVIPYSEIPGLHVGSVQGHASTMELRSYGTHKLVVCSGRIHAYEGHSDVQCLQLIDVLTCLGVTSVIITNAAGGLHWRYQPGDVALITDTIDLTFLGPQPTSRNNPSIQRSPLLRDSILESCARNGLALETGTYCQLTGPSYETRAEIKMLRRLGADLVGMSTVREIRYAQSLGHNVAAFSMITNTLSETIQRSVSHAEVLDVAGSASNHLTRIIDTTLSNLLT